MKNPADYQMTWRDNEFKIGINMAGAVSAGAYTAGVLDFLMEALEQWQLQKEALRRYLSDPVGPVPLLVPLHDVTIEVFAGASAGGMCAAIASVMVQQDFVHIRTAEETGTNNTFYEAWVNQIAINELLKTRDVDNGGPLVSLLDSTIIDTIAKGALTPTATTPRSYISEHLTLLLAITNVRGTPYQLYSDPAPTIEEFIAYYGDRLQFETTQGTAAPVAVHAKPLPAGAPDTGGWPLLQQAAKATGAFPLFLAPRPLTRDTKDYETPPWATGCTVTYTPPAFPTPPPNTIETLNVDAGLTNNNPFQLAHDYLASQNPKANECHNPTPALEANCAIITVAPFPASDTFNTNYQPSQCASIWRMLGKLLTVLVAQSRFLGESLAVLTSGAGFSRFVIAPASPAKAGTSTLQCGLLGAFGGFFARGFRAHDFLLGRRNCQKFLSTHFCLPTDNPTMKAGQQRAGALANAIALSCHVPPPNPALTPLGLTWLPLIPCVGTAQNEVPLPEPAQLAASDLDQIVDALVRRLKGIKVQLLAGAPLLLRMVAGVALAWPFVHSLKKQVRTTLADGLCPNVEGQQATDCTKDDNPL
jgi:hypothetical protein